MKTWNLEFRESEKENFDQIQSGVKTIETRAAAPKYQDIKEGDELLFICGEEKLAKKIVKIRHFKNLDEIFEQIPYKNIMPSVESADELKGIYLSYPEYDKSIEKFGMFAFELE
jgi:ASC-1-like (ASCH) protein